MRTKPPSESLDFTAAWAKALRRASAREYGEAEMGAYLLRAGAPEKVADRVVRRMVKEKLIDDLRFARALVREQALKDKGPGVILMKLQAKGVASDLGQVRALWAESRGEDEAQAARRIVEKRYPGALQEKKSRQRAFNALLRRGFSPDVVLSVLQVPENGGI